MSWPATHLDGTPVTAEEVPARRRRGIAKFKRTMEIERARRKESSMYKTASQIADYVLEKVAISDAKVDKAWDKKFGRKPGESFMGSIDRRLGIDQPAPNYDKYPRAKKRIAENLKRRASGVKPKVKVKMPRSGKLRNIALAVGGVGALGAAGTAAYKHFSKKSAAEEPDWTQAAGIGLGTVGGGAIGRNVAANMVLNEAFGNIANPNINLGRLASKAKWYPRLGFLGGGVLGGAAGLGAVALGRHLMND